MKDIRKLALFDMDDTLCDYSGQLFKDMIKIDDKSRVPQYIHFNKEKNPSWMEERKRLITSQKNWWYKLPKLQLGWDILNLAQEIGFEIMILTKGPLSKENAWEEKVRWCKKYLGENVNITITTDKSIMYGTVLVDDYPPYALNWLEHRPRGIVIMPQHLHNSNNAIVNRHQRITLYNGDKISLSNVKKKLIAAYER